MIYDVISIARHVAIEEAGSDDPAIIIEVLARMLILSAHGSSAGYLRLPPGRPVMVTPPPKSINE